MKFIASFIYTCGIMVMLSCNTSTGSNSTHKDQIANVADEVTDGNTSTFKAHLAPASGSKYSYTITNESATELEANGKTVNTRHKSAIGITYDVQKDSAGNYVLRLHYDKIHLYTKTGDNETELDAANAAATLDPTEKMQTPGTFLNSLITKGNIL